MPEISYKPSPLYGYRGSVGSGTFSSPNCPCVKFNKGELTEKEEKQVNVMRTLDFGGLMLIAERMNETGESFTTAYWVIRNQGDLR